MRKFVYKGNPKGKATLISVKGSVDVAQRKADLKEELHAIARELFQVDDGQKIKAFMTNGTVDKEVAARDASLRQALKSIKQYLIEETDENNLDRYNVKKELWKLIKAEYVSIKDFEDIVKSEFGEE